MWKHHIQIERMHLLISAVARFDEFPRFPKETQLLSFLKVWTLCFLKTSGLYLRILSDLNVIEEHL